MALAIKIGGPDALGNYLLRWLTVGVFALQLALFPLLAERIGLSRMTGFFAALIYLMGDYATANWDANYVGLLLVLLALLSLEDPQSRSETSVTVASGLIWGALVLFTPVVIVVLPLWIVWIHRCRRMNLARLAVTSAIALVIVTPWMVRNYAVFYRVVLVRDNLGLELATSNNDCAAFTFARNVDSGCYALHHPNVNGQEAHLMQSMGEVEYNRTRMKEATAWILAHPGRYISLSIRRAVAFWFAFADPSEALTAIATVLSFFGMLVIWRKSPCVFLFLLMWLAVFPVSFYFIVAFEERHRIPILWATFIPATEGILRLMGANLDEAT